MEDFFLNSTPIVEAIIQTAHPVATGTHHGFTPNEVLKKAITKMNALIISGTNKILTGQYLTMKKQQIVFTTFTIKKPKELVNNSG